jgi:hypothetical protein
MKGRASMPDVLVLEFDTPQALDLYKKVSGILNVDPSTGSGDWPPPLLHHVAGNAGDKLIVVEVWESKAAQEDFMQKDLSPAFQKAQVPPPTRVEWFAHAGEMHRHAQSR